jgi:hypothetical protein
LPSLIRNERVADLVQYEALDVPVIGSNDQVSLPKSYYGRLEHIVSVEFSGGCEALGLAKGVTIAFALFHRCILTNTDPRLERLGVYFYSGESENLHVTEVSRVHGLVGRIKGGPGSWAIIDRSGSISREAYLTHESHKGTG